ncbi:glycosyl hydrolase family 28-related protein [Bradyrhizobium commune]|uniref:Right-handed parallel beta-helix repeat-containing protein n=1 Tax=Bradyrhizobium commune TaxID=83627 RepID=A0A7S9DBG9_9BRAD|nr:glycosyl hydrolase family 28-related protein [Bradyrhizobium commune]QPF94563.1 right-handed parallel beta-helix repeat-containing protein [Bradyrhizobium commune]
MFRSLCIAFALIVLAVADADAQPHMFWFNDPVGPDDTVIVTGSQLDAVTAISISRVPDGASGGDGSAPRSVELIQQDAQSVKFVVPKEFAPGVYRFTLTYPQGESAALLNRPTIYWVQTSLGDTVSPGGEVRIFGRNIVRRLDRAKLIMVPERAGQPVTLSPSAGNLWHGRFRLPDTVAPGDYRLRLSNGNGTDEDVVDAERIHVVPAVAETGAIFNVREYGAFGDGVINASRAVRAAISAAQQGGGTVYFPRGRYLITGPLMIPPHVTLKGERTDLVNLVWSDVEDPPEALIAGTSHFAIEDLTIYASRHRHIVAGGFLNGVPIPNASDIALRRVRIRASAFRGHTTAEQTYQRMLKIEQQYGQFLDTIRLTGDRLTVTDCDVVGSGRSLYLLKASNAVISGNILNNGRLGWYSFTGVKRVIFENNTVTAADLQGTGGSINTLSPDVTGSENVFFANNISKAIYGWDREAISSDGGGGFYFGPAVSVAPDQLSLPGPANEHVIATTWVGALVMVVDGLGAGQFARVVRFDPAGNNGPMSVTLDRKLAVDLDATSVVTVVQMHQNYLIVDNTFQDVGVAAQFYGTGLNHVLAGNVATRTGGFFDRGMTYHHFQPSWQVQLLNNRITEGNAYQAGPDRTIASGEALIAVQAVRSLGVWNLPPLVRGVIVRGNRMDNDSHIEVTGVTPAFPGVRDVVIEDNVIGASRVGLVIDRGVLLTTERRNTVNVIDR